MKKILSLVLLLIYIPAFAPSTNIDYKEVVIKEIRLTAHKLNVINSIIAIESNGNELAFNELEDAAGIMQIRPIMVDEINRLLGFKKYNINDRWNAEMSKSLFIDLQDFYNPAWDLEIAARTWNGGLNGMNKPSTVNYFKKIKAKYVILTQLN
jgi:hypothetical protein